MSKKKAILFIVAAFVVGGMIAPVAVNAAQKVFDPTASTWGDGYSPGGVGRWDDPDFQVKCWSLYSDGISCLPWSEVKER